MIHARLPYSRRILVMTVASSHTPWDKTAHHSELNYHEKDVLTKVNIGVALSGCDIGGVASYSALQELENQGFRIQMISTTSLPSITGAMFALGDGYGTYKKAASSFLDDARNDGLDTAIFNISARMGKKMPGQGLPLAINAANMENRRIVTFTDDFALDSQSVVTMPLGRFYDALSATVSRMDGLSDYRFQSFRLCDYSVLHGCPLYPLKMQGIKRIISIAFQPVLPATPYEMMNKTIIDRSGEGADLHISIQCPLGCTLEEYERETKAALLGISERLEKKIEIRCA